MYDLEQIYMNQTYIYIHILYIYIYINLNAYIFEICLLYTDSYHPVSGRTLIFHPPSNGSGTSYPIVPKRIECTIGVYGPHVSSCEIPSSLFFQPLWVFWKKVGAELKGWGTIFWDAINAADDTGRPRKMREIPKRPLKVSWWNGLN